MVAKLKIATALSRAIAALVVVTAISALLFPVTDSNAQSYTFEGKWDCEGLKFTFSKDAWNNGAETLRYAKVEKEGKDYLIHFHDGYRFALFDVFQDMMIWHSPESGDQFTCKRMR